MNLIWISGALKFGFFGCDSCTAVFVGKQSQTYITYIYISIYNVNTMFIDIISVFIRAYIFHKYYIYLFLFIFSTNIHRFEAGYVNQWTFSSLDLNFPETSDIVFSISARYLSLPEGTRRAPTSLCGVITLLIEIIFPVTHLFSAIYRDICRVYTYIYI